MREEPKVSSNAQDDEEAQTHAALLVYMHQLRTYHFFNHAGRAGN